MRRIDTVHFTVFFLVSISRYDPKEKIEEMIAMATYVQKNKTWKLYWQRADLNWHSYEPNPEVKDFEEFIRTVEEDEFCCFWG